MSTLRNALAIITLAGLAACGSGGSKSPLPTTAPAAITRVPDAHGTVTLKFPAHVAKASVAAKGKLRAPAYINPGGVSLVVTAFGQTLHDPEHPANAYFSLGTQDLTTGTSTITVPLLSGEYDDGDLTVTEYDGLGTGNILAYGFNASYTDANGNAQDGVFFLAAGANAAPVLTMNMNATRIAITTDPVAGSNAELISTNTGSPTTIGFCLEPGTPVFAFAADPSATFVLPGQSTGSGFTGADPNNSFPGIAVPFLAAQSSDGTPLTIMSPTLTGGYSMSSPLGNSFNDLTVTFQVNNPAGQFNNPFNFLSTVTGTVNFNNGNC
jgi:hypothetical protein